MEEKKFVITATALEQLVNTIGNLKGEVSYFKVSPIIQFIQQSFVELKSEPDSKKLIATDDNPKGLVANGNKKQASTAGETS